jgi:hypothetical protein
MSDIDPTAAAAAEPVDPTAVGDSGAGGGEEPPADAEEAPWYKNPVIIAIIVIALLALGAFAIWGGSDDDEGANVNVTDSLTTDELKELCVAQEGSASDEACAELITSLSDQEKQDITNGCIAGDQDACRLLELIGEPVPTPTTTAPPTTSAPGDTIIIIPPPEPGEPTPPDPTIPDLPDPTLDELVEACLAEDGETSEQACEYLADNLTDSQMEAVRTLCDDGNEDACKLLELMGEDVPTAPAPTTTTAA